MTLGFWAGGPAGFPCLTTVGRCGWWCALMMLVADAGWNALRAGRRGVCLAVALAVVSACSSTEVASRPTSAAGVVVTSQQPYLEEVLGVVLGEAYYANELDASRWRTEADELEGQGAAVDERYDFVRRLLVALGDRHSSFYTPSEEGPRKENFFLPPTGEIDDQRVGRLRLPGLSGSNDEVQRYVSAALDVLAGDACGWILDLRGDNGGNVFAMLAAIGPLLGPGPALSYQHRNGSVDSYGITPEGGLAAQDGTVLSAALTTAIRFGSDLPIAVLQGSSTASAGEGIVMATRGRNNVRSFGHPTAGLPTGNTLFEFSDGSAVNLTVAIGIDAAGEPHEGPIPPDATTDNADADAVAWLLAQPNCQPPQ